MSNAITDFVNALGFQNDSLTLQGVAGIFIFLLCMSLLGELIHSVIGGLRK